MKNRKATFNILGRIRQLCAERGWSDYELARHCGLTQSTISSWSRKNSDPNVATIEKICEGCGITLAEFFSDPTPRRRRPYSDLELLIRRLTPDQREAVIRMIQSFVEARR